MSSNQFSQKSFTLFTINYIVGFGFLTTILGLIKLNIYGIIVLIATAFITFGVSLVFSRLANNFKNDYGGTYAFSKKLNNKNFSFFLGWNQYIQGPILSSTGPLFLADAASYFTEDTTTIWIIRACSVLFFILLVLVSTLGINLNKKIIFVSGIVKWSILLFSLAVGLYLSIKQNNFEQNLTFTNNSSFDAYLIFSNILSFMYAFGGIEDVSAMSKDVNFKNFKKILMVAFAFILSFYFVFYIVLLGIDTSSISNFSQIFKISMQTTGLVIFVVGLIFNGISSKISINLSTARKLVALSEDGYIFEFIKKQNSKNEYKNAIWFNASLTIFSMLIFWLIPSILNISSFFESVIQIGSIAFLLQYFFTFLIAIILSFKKQIEKINIFELIVYIISMLLILTILIIFLFPFVVNKQWTATNTIIITSYVSFVLIGYAIKLIFSIKNNKKLTK